MHFGIWNVAKPPPSQPWTFWQLLTWLIMRIYSISCMIGLDLLDTALNWFNSYLRPRSCVVTIQKARSSERDLAFSVPQGSCAGQVLFLAYTSTFLQVVDTQLNICGFADDHNLGCGFIPGIPGNKDELKKITILTNSLKSINTWMNRNRLQMNNAKTEVLLIDSQSQLNKCI